MDHLDAAERSVAKLTEWTERHAADVEAAYLEDGYSLSKIADRLGITLEAVRQRLLQRGVDLRPQGRSRSRRG